MPQPSHAAQRMHVVGYYAFVEHSLFKTVRMDNGSERVLRVSQHPSKTTVEKLEFVMRVACADPETRYRAWQDSRGEIEQ